MNLSIWQRRLLLLSLFWLAFGLRVYHLDHFSFWVDEGLTPLRAGYDVPEILSGIITIQEGLSKDTHPPLYYLTVHFGMRLMGDSDFAIRMLSVWFSVLLVAVIYRLGRAISSIKTGLLAALLITLSPLQIWYAQDARMYTLIVLLGAAMSWQLLAAMNAEKLSFRHAVTYLVLAGLAFYTHYTAAFLIAFQILFWAWLRWQRGLKRWIIGAVVLMLLVALPVLPTIVPRLMGPPEASYYFVPLRVMLWDIVHGFGQGLTTDATLTLTKIFDWGIFALLVVGLMAAWRGKNQKRALFLLSWLLAALIGLAVVSRLFKPAYLGVRHIMIGSPAFTLLLALGFKRLGRVHKFIPPLALTLLIGGNAIALNNLYHDDTYAKEDYRALTAYVDQHAGENDIVLYNNAILLPNHWHYKSRPALPSTALPVYPYMFSEQSKESLEALAEQYDRIWFMPEPPQDKRDPDGVVRSWITENLMPVDERRFHARYTDLVVTAYDTKPTSAETLPLKAIPTNFTLNGLPALHAIDLSFTQPATTETLWIDTWWDSTDDPQPDRNLQWLLLTPDGKTWFQTNLPISMAAAEPTDAPFRRTSYGLQLPFGTPPGRYTLALAAWDTASQSALSAPQSVADIEIGIVNFVQTTQTKPDYSTNRPRSFEEGITLLGLTYADSVKPGHPLPLTLFWQLDKPLTRPLFLRLEVVGREGVLRTEGFYLGGDWLAAQTIPPNQPVRQPIGIYFPPDTPPGVYQLRWKLLEYTHMGKSSAVSYQSKKLVLGRVTVQPWPFVKNLPDIDTPLTPPANQFGGGAGGGATLAAYTLDRDPAGKTLDLTLYWQASNPTETSNAVFVHLVPVNGNPQAVAQSDGIPASGLRPTNGWRNGEIITDPHSLTLTNPYPLTSLSDLPPGQYQLYLGLYDPQTGLRQPVTADGIRLPNDQLPLTTLTLP